MERNHILVSLNELCFKVTSLTFRQAICEYGSCDSFDGNDWTKSRAELLRFACDRSRGQLIRMYAASLDRYVWSHRPSHDNILVSILTQTNAEFR